jgi:hypothetical protein
VVADAGQGIERGVQRANAARVAESQEPAAAKSSAMGRDVFPTHRELQRIVPGQWRRAERLLEAAAQADTTVAQDHQRGREARGVAKQAWGAWRQAEQMFEAAVQAEAAVARLQMALALLRPDGGLSDRQWAQGHIRAALAELPGQAWGKVRRVLSDPRTLPHLAWVQAQWAEAVAEPLWREACTRLWDWREAGPPRRGQTRARLAQVVVMDQVICQRLCPEWQVA